MYLSYFFLGTQLCIKGECSGSICLAWNMKECFLSSSPTKIGDGVTAVVDRRALCQLACQTGPDPDSCRSTAEFASSVGLPPGGISLRPGSPCDNFQVKNGLKMFWHFIFYYTDCVAKDLFSILLDPRDFAFVYYYFSGYVCHNVKFYS